MNCTSDVDGGFAGEPALLVNPVEALSHRSIIASDPLRPDWRSSHQN